MAGVPQASIPLADVFPWTLQQDPSSILIVDSLESDGRFLLYEIATQVLLVSAGDLASSSTTASSKNSAAPLHPPRPPPRSSATPPAPTQNHGSLSRVLWLSGSPVTPRLIRNGLKRMGCPLVGAATTATAAHQQDRLVIRSLTEELGTALLNGGGGAGAGGGVSPPSEDSTETTVPSRVLDLEDWVRNHLLSSLHQWAMASSLLPKNDKEDEQRPSGDDVSWILLDDVSTLVTLLGEKLVLALIQSVQALARARNIGLVVRCTREDVPFQPVSAKSSSVSSSYGDWIGASGSLQVPRSSPWQSLLVELVDHVVDVCPLPSGPTRDAHGKLVMSHIEYGRMSVCNYCLTDTKALAIRLRR